MKKHFKNSIIGLLSLSGIFYTGLIKAQSIMTLDTIAAVVNDDVITQLELTDEFKNIIKVLKQKNTKLPPANVLVKQVLDRMILERVQLDLAERTGIKVDDTTLSLSINRIAAQNNMSVSEFRQKLASQGINFLDFRDDIKKQIILKRLVQRNVVNKINITDKEIENFLFNINKQGGLEKSYQLKHILISTPEAASPAIIKQAASEASKLVEELRAGKDFSATALAVSDGQTALEGGDMGWRKAGEIPSLFLEAVHKMKVGEISDPIRSPSGFHIVKIVNEKGGKKHLVEQTHARHILIKPSIINDDDRVIERLKKIRQRIINGDDFATMAKAHSDDTASATKGGDLGWFKAGTMVPEFDAAIKKMQPGELSGIIKSPFGYHIIELLGRRTHDDADEHLKDKAREVLKARKVNEEKAAFYRRIRDEAFVEIRLQ